MIKMQNVSKSYTFKNKTVRILNDVSIEVNPGEIFGIIGKSGAGKSTVIKCLNMLEKPDSGSKRIENGTAKDWCNLPRL